MSFPRERNRPWLSLEILLLLLFQWFALTPNEGNETNMHFHINQINEADFLDLLGQSLEETTICTLSLYFQHLLPDSEDK